MSPCYWLTSRITSAVTMQVDCLSYKLREMILLKSCWLMIRAEMKSERRPHVNAYIRLTSVCCHFCEVVKDEHFCYVVRGLSPFTDMTLVQTSSL